VRNSWIRRSAGGVGLLAAVWVAGAASHSGAQDSKAVLPDGAAVKMIQADVVFLEKALEKKPKAAEIATIKATALLIALNAQNSMGGDANKMAAIRASALSLAKSANTDSGKFSDADYMATKKAFADLKSGTAAGADKAPVPVSKMTESSGVDLDWLMRGAFKPPAKVGTMDTDKMGRQIEKNIRDMAQKKKPADAALATDAGNRSVVVGEFTLAMPHEDAKKNPAKMKQWEDFTKEMIKVGKEVAAEGTKAAKADKAELQKKLSKLDGTCVACHEVFKAK
jgi:cytochrome c556